jgi:hypothetical protein
VSDPAAGGRDGTRSGPGSGRSRLDQSTRIYLHLTDDWLADEYRRAAERIDADAAAELLAMQAINR